MKRLLSLLVFLGLSACMQGGGVNSFAPTTGQGYGLSDSEVLTVSGDTPELTPGERLPFGSISKACGISKSQLGKPVANFPENGSKYKVYDTKPGSSGPRTFYLTGFRDGCPRQFTASLAVFGDIGVYEHIRYGVSSKTMSYSTTDKAYEQLKSRVCRVSKNSPCGNKIGKLERNTVFLSVYERFGSNKQWVNILLHKGDIIAMDEKKG